MRISLKHNLVFLSYPKTASTSVGAFLDTYSEIFPVKPTLTDDQHPFYKHMTAREMVSAFTQKGWRWDDFYSFCVVRNPYDRMVSAFHYRKGLMTRPVTTRGKCFNVIWWLRNKVGPELTFERFLNSYNPRKISYMPLQDFIGDGSGNNLLTRIIRFENLSHDLNEVLRDIGLDLLPDEIALPKLNRTDSRGNYRSYYSDITRAIIENKYAFELAEFGYSF